MSGTTIKEEFSAADHDVNGQGSVVPDPVSTGVTARPQDNTANGEAGIVHSPGVGDVPQGAALKSLLVKLAGLPADVLAKIANEIDANSDVEANPSGATDGAQAGNLASILSVAEDIEQMFAGEELSEDFKAKAAVIYESTMKAHLAIATAEIKDILTEEKNAEVAAAVETITEEMVDKMDRYLSYAADEFVTENKVEIETSIQSTTAVQFMAEMFELAKRYNVIVPETEINVVEELETKVAELESKLNESLESNIDSAAKIKALETEKSFRNLTEGMTATQRERVAQLAEGVDFSSVEDYESKVGILVESVIKSTTEKKPSAQLITESTVDGVPLINEENETKVLDPTVSSVLNHLRNAR